MLDQQTVIETGIEITTDRTEMNLEWNW